MSFEATTRRVAGQIRPAVRWGGAGRAYACALDGDCSEAVIKAMRRARQEGADAEERLAALEVYFAEDGYFHVPEERKEELRAAAAKDHVVRS